MKPLLRIYIPLLCALALTGISLYSARADHTSAPASAAITGSLQSELGCPGDWQEGCPISELAYDGDDEVWQATFSLPSGSWEYKLTINDSWAENYGAGGVHDGANIALTLGGATDVKFYYDHDSHWITDNVNSVIATAAGDFQSELGCPGDWQPDCLRSWLQDADGDGIYTFSTSDLPEGSYEAKVALHEGWDESYGDSNGNNIPFSVTAGATVLFSYNALSHAISIEVSGGLEPGDSELVRAPVRTEFGDEFVYFVMPDRFANGDPTNDTAGADAGILSTPPVHGYLPTHKGYYHGGDLAGLMSKLDYLDNLGVTALWLTPQFTNRWIQGDGTINGSTAAYHGYWQIDYTQIDPHFGTNAEMVALIEAAHARGIKVFFDVVVNHTGDVISYQQGTFTYRSKEDYPYRDADGAIFDDREYVGTGTFPALDADVSFPYTPIFPEAGDESVKNPAWLNDPIYYHNRGDSTFSGENSLYGDFFGLDDLFTEHPQVVAGMIDIHKNMITDFGVDGFRVDTVKHVNDEFWQAFVPAIVDHAAAEGKPDFALFGEVFDGNPEYLSHFTKELGFPSLLDFGFHGAALGFASSSNATNNLASFFASDDQYTDADSNAHGLVKFIGNHDVGRLGYFIDGANDGASDAERLARAVLAHALSSFSRGVPVIYYGDEQGFTGDGGDQDARQDMFPSLVPSYVDDNSIGTAATPADDNFDESHVLYQTISDFTQLREAHVALRQGAQLHRYSEGSAGIYAFSRIDRDEKIEYVVALNNAETADNATFRTDSPSTTFTQLWPGTGPALSSDAAGNLSVDVPALDFVLYRAESPIAAPAQAPAIAFTTPLDGSEITGNTELGVDLSGAGYAEVSFAVSIDGGAYETIGTDDNPPYRVFYDVSALPAGTPLSFRAIVADAAGNLNATATSAVVAAEFVPGTDALYAVIHYMRDDGDYGDHTTGDFNDFWGLHLWGDGIDPSEVTDWTSPKPFLGEDDYGRFAWIKLQPGATEVNFIIHRGNTKDGTDADRSFNPAVTPEIWTRQGNDAAYATRAEAQGFVTVHYHRPDGNYDGWGLHLWGAAIDPAEGTSWDSPKPPTGIDTYGAFFDIAIIDINESVNFIVHRGDTKDPADSPDRSFVPAENAAIWLQSGDVAVYPSRGAATDTATIHYHRPAGDYGDYGSSDFNDFWGMHVWEGAASPNPSWQQPLRPSSLDLFGPVFDVALVDGAPQLAYILHSGDNKDPGPDQFLVLDKWGYEVWQLQGENPADPEEPHYVLPILSATAGNAGNIDQQQAYWVDESTIAWAAATSTAHDYRLYYAPTGGLEATVNGITGGDFIELTLDPNGLPQTARNKFPHLADLPALTINSTDLALVPDILRGQIAVSAVDADGLSVDATGLQIPGVLDDLYTYGGTLGASWDNGIPTLRLWAPTAKSVTLHRYGDADPTTLSTSAAMTLDPTTGIWSISGDANWKNEFYLYEVEVYVHATGAVEHNLVTDPYSFSLATNSSRSQIVDLADAALAPAGWESLSKPPLAAPEDISVYEIHMRDFSVNDPLVPDEFKGTFKAFTLDDSYGIRHLRALQEAGLSHLHLLPVFDIATINEDKSTWQSPDPAVLATYPPDSEEQQAAVSATAEQDAFNWGYDPFHYTAPEGSYSTDPNGATRVVEFREMVQSLNEMDLRVVMDVVYNHTNASGQAEKSVLDRIVPGYYHRLTDTGAVETSTCCQNTATEHNMMEKLMIDSVLTWATEYKVDAFRFDLMGHHMVDNMLALRAALDGLTLAEDGVDGGSIYLYGEGWNFGEVANNARGVNATQLNLAGTGIGTFSDRLRDAVRGPGPFAGGDSLQQQGFASGLFYDPNSYTSSQKSLEAQRADLLLRSDQIRVGMAGNLADYQFIDRNGNLVSGAEVDYNGQPSGYTQDPQEDITYVSKHDNQTLYDIFAYGIPDGTSMADRVRIQTVGLSTVLLGQGVPFLHAGSDLLRSKSFDRDSYNSGDWFNMLDFTYNSNNFGVGLPVAGVNEDNWFLMRPRLADPALRPAPADIAFSAALVQELLQIRYSSELFRLETEADVQARVGFYNTGPDQIPGLIAMSLSDRVEPDLDRRRERVVVLINANDASQTLAVAELAGVAMELHEVQQASIDAVVRGATYDPSTGAFTVPGRTVAVFVELAAPAERINGLIGDVDELQAAGWLNKGQANSLRTKLTKAQASLDKGKNKTACNNLGAFVNQVEAFVRGGVLSPAQGQPLIEQAQSIVAQICPNTASADASDGSANSSSQSTQNLAAEPALFLPMLAGQ